MEQIGLDGLRIAYERVGHGAGPPLVLTHGFVGDARSTWSAQIEALSDEYTVLAWDLPGAGQSSPPPEWFRLPDYADCLAGLLGALGVARAHLGGLSFGGMVALSTFERHPALAESLILLNTYAGWSGSFTPEEVEERLRTCRRVAELAPEEFTRAMLPSMFSASAPRGAVDQFAVSARVVNSRGFMTMARASAEGDLREMLGTIDVPTLVLSGDADVRAPLTVARALHDSIPGSQLVVMPGVGHVSAVEAPELVSRHMRDFLRSLESHGTRS
jgi:pimeloyl-ACP methyl ester carboxylesterase